MINQNDNIRRKLADSLCSAVSSYPAPDPLAVTPQSIEFFGQRPWRPGKQDSPDLAKEKEGIEALQYRERTRTKHSQIILDLLRLATEQFEKFKSPRMKSRLTLQMAEEEMAEGEYSAALDTLLPCLPAYRWQQDNTFLHFRCLLEFCTGLRCGPPFW